MDEVFVKAETVHPDISMSASEEQPENIDDIFVALEVFHEERTEADVMGVLANIKDMF